MKKIWFHGLALSLGVTTLPGVANAQYSIGGNSGLSPSSFQLPARPEQTSVPSSRWVAHSQQGGAIGSGVAGDLSSSPASDIPSVSPALPTGQSSRSQNDPYSLGQPLPYESSPIYTTTTTQGAASQSPGTIHSAPAVPSSPAASILGNCPACAAGNCSTHGVGAEIPAPISKMENPSSAGPIYGVGDSSSLACTSPAAVLTPSVVSPSPWIFGASGLLFNRIDDYNRRLASSGETRYLSTGDAAMRASGGFQSSFGRYFGCGKYALVATYWGVFSEAQTAMVTPGTGVNIRTDLPFTPIAPGTAPVPPWYGAYMPGPRTLYDWYDSGSTNGSNNPAFHTQRVVRDNDFQNVEVNLFSFALGGGARQPYADGCGTGHHGHGGGLGLKHRLGGHSGSDCNDPCGSTCAAASGPTGPCAPWYGAQCSKLRLNTFGGIRWFRFGDDFEYAASQSDNVFGNTADDIYYTSNVTNDLVGIQLGSMGTWCTGTRFNLFGGTSFGIYNNHIQTATRAGTATTDAMIRPLGSPATADVAYNFTNSKDDVAFMGEGTMGVGARICRGWTMNLGYRVLGVSGVATAVGQIPGNFTHVDQIRGIHNDRSLILHGAVLGAMYNF
jgi:hypothetical protein